MGLAKSIFTVDNHVIPQPLGAGYPGDDPESMLLFHMDRYNVDVCVLKSHYHAGVNKNKLIADMVKRHPDRFVGLCCDYETQRKEAAKEAPWSIKDAVKELDELMSTGLYAGIGEGFPRDRNPRKPLLSWDVRMDEIFMVLELCRKYKSPLHYITGKTIGAQSWRNDMARNVVHGEFLENGSPLLCIELAAWYPDVPIILSHSGVEGSSYYMDDYEKCLYVAASHRNVFLDCGQWWAELFEKPLLDVNIGAEKILWGTGWGQPNLVQQTMPGQVPTTFNVMNLNDDRSPDTCDIWGWSQRELGRLNIPQDDLNLIMGGNAVHLFNIKTPQPADRLFKKAKRRYLSAEIPKGE